MTQLIEPIPIRQIWDSQTVLKRLARLIDDGGCTGPLDGGIDEYFLPTDDDDLYQGCTGWDSKEAQEVLRRAIGRAWGLR